jgi:hypothetical protein
MDFSKPYGLVYGIPGIHYEQDGVGYNNKGYRPGEKEEVVYPPAADDGFTKKEIIDALEYLGLRNRKDFFSTYRREKLLAILLKATPVD